MCELILYQSSASTAVGMIAKTTEDNDVSTTVLDGSIAFTGRELEILKSARVFHSDASALLSEPKRSNLYQVFDIAAKNGAIVSYAPRIDPAQWPVRSDLLRILRSPVTTADIIQVLPEELLLLTGETELEAGACILADQGVRLVLVMQEDCMLLRFKHEHRKISGVNLCHADAFLGEFLSRIVKMNKNLKAYTYSEIESLASAAVVASHA